MSILDKVAAALTPPESVTDREEARRLAHSYAAPNDWLGMVLQHHEQLELLFDRVKQADTADSRLAAQRELGALLTGHSIAEEAVLYPAIVKSGETGQATMLYTEQQAAKINMFLLENLDPMSQEYLDKLEHIRGAVVHHMYEEEGSKYVSLKQHTLEADQDMLTARFREEFERYMSGVKATGQQRFGEHPDTYGERRGHEMLDHEPGFMLQGDRSMPQSEGAVTQQRDFAAQAQRNGAQPAFGMRDERNAQVQSNPDMVARDRQMTPEQMQMQHHGTTAPNQGVGPQTQGRDRPLDDGTDGSY